MNCVCKKYVDSEVIALQEFAINLLLSGWLLWLGRVIIGLMLVIAGSLKVQAGTHWILRTLLAYELMPYKASLLLAKGLPWAEIICGTMLLFGWLTPWATLASFGLLCLFTVALMSAIWRQKQVNCGCFGRSRHTTPVRWRLIYRNLVLMAILIVVTAFGPGSLAIDTWLQLSLLDTDLKNFMQSWLFIIWIGILVANACLHYLSRKQVGRRQPTPVSYSEQVD